MYKHFLSILLVATVILLSPESKADWINLTGAENARNIAELYVEKDGLRVKLEVFVEDLHVFEELMPDQLFSSALPERPGPDIRMQIFADSVLQIITDTGEKLSAELVLAEPRMRIKRPSPLVGSINPYTGNLIPGPPEDKRVLYAELMYSFKGQPKSLTIIPPVNDDGFLKTSIGFICYHLDVPVVDFRQLTDRNLLHLEWDDPWYSFFAEKQLKRSLQSGIRNYLYIEPYEVRHEILVRVKDMMTWMDFNLRGNDYIEKDEFNPVREKMARFFMDRENVLIDGRKGKPILDRTAYVESSMLRSRFIDIPERLPLNTAMVGIVITYLTDGIPGKVITEWDLFSDRVQKVTGSMVDPAGPFPYDLTPGDNVLKWTNYLKTYTLPTIDTIMVNKAHRGIPVPIGSVAMVILLLIGVFTVINRRKQQRSVTLQLSVTVVLAIGAVVLFPFWHISVGKYARASQMSDQDSKAIILSLLKNVYRAFDFRDEEDVYDKLAISVSGSLLNDVYLQSRKSMIIEQAGGAQAKVKQTEVLEVDVKESRKQKGALDIRTKWTAIGTVGHWGHNHTRQNVYDAILTLIVEDGSWKISDIELLEEKRVDPYK